MVRHMINNILFDLDDTLLDFKKAERIALAKSLKFMGFVPDERILNRYSEINLQQWKLLELGKITRDEDKISRYELLFAEFGINASPQTAAKAYEKFLGQGYYFMPEAEAVLKELSREYNLYIVSNGTLEVQKSRIASSGISQYMKGIFISQEIGFDKPNIRFFEACFEKIPNFKKEETIIVGDSLTSDIKGGTNSGITSVWFNPSKAANNTDIKPDKEIARLTDLKEILKGK